LAEHGWLLPIEAKILTAIAKSLLLTPPGIGSHTCYGERGMGEKKYRWSSAAMTLAVLGIASTAPAAFAQSDWLQELEAGCNAGEGQDCANLGGQLRLGHITPKDLPGARAAFEKGCKLDSLNACAELYKSLSLGEGGPKDLARAKELSGRVCDTGIISLDVYLEASGLCIE
jgi:TPR repeat protein